MIVTSSLHGWSARYSLKSMATQKKTQPYVIKHYIHCINSSPPSAAYMHHLIGSALVQIMACRLFRAIHLNQVTVNWTLKNKHQWNLNQNTKLVIEEKASKNIVCEIVAILSRGKWVKDIIKKDKAYIKLANIAMHHFHDNNIRLWNRKYLQANLIKCYVTCTRFNQKGNWH